MRCNLVIYLPLLIDVSTLCKNSIHGVYET